MSPAADCADCGRSKAFVASSRMPLIVRIDEWIHRRHLRSPRWLCDRADDRIWTGFPCSCPGDEAAR